MWRTCTFALSPRKRKDWEETQPGSTLTPSDIKQGKGKPSWAFNIISMNTVAVKFMDSLSWSSPPPIADRVDLVLI